MRCSISLIAIISLAACEDRFHAAQEAAAYNMLDPDSAQFREMEMVGDTVCGQINAKNRMGAYVGFTPFYAVEIADEWVVEYVRDEDDYAALLDWRQACRPSRESAFREAAPEEAMEAAPDEPYPTDDDGLVEAMEAAPDEPLEDAAEPMRSPVQSAQATQCRAYWRSEEASVDMEPEANHLYFPNSSREMISYSLD